MKYKIKVGNKYLVGESASETLKGTVRGDTTAVYSRFVGEMSAYDFCDNIEDADPKDAVTACDYVRGIMERQNYGFYPGEIKLIDADAEETVVHCKKEENANVIAMILDADAEGKVSEAVPVPPHGDLIDRDKLEKDIDKYIGGEESRSRFHHWVQVQRAVIHKSEEAHT